MKLYFVFFGCVSVFILGLSLDFVHKGRIPLKSLQMFIKSSQILVDFS